MRAYCWLYSVLLCQLAIAPLAAQDAPDDIAFFERHVRPLLAARCYECHAAKSDTENGGLVLDHVAGLLAGGSRGPLLDRQSPERSLLLRAVSYTGTDLQMPPDGKLTAAELNVLQQWIAKGAPLPEATPPDVTAPRGMDLEAGRQFWSFRPLAQVPIPATPDAAWVRMPLDAFVLQQLANHQLPPSPPTDRTTWLRRVTFDLVGLPPTPEEVANFLADRSPDAFVQVVDRLLASPRYGERWGRVWLDLARYTDQTPDWQNPTDCGWLYRDWVIRALNQDLPFDQFVRWQLAADLLPDVAPQDLAALGFLGLSPTYWKELRLAPAVIEQIVADEWDERLDAVTRTFLGLTVACARCHDHKFDPITNEDYYALAGVFASTQLDRRPLLAADEAQAVRTAHQQVAELEAKLKSLPERQTPEAGAMADRIRAIQASTPHYDSPWAHVVREASVFVEPDGQEMTKLVYHEGQARDVPIFRRGNPLNPGPLVHRGFLKLFNSPSAAGFDQGSGRAELAEALFGNAQGLVARVIVNRIWDQHFQAGLVRTPSDFGTQGDRPSHPELLEYLAHGLVDHGWDLKWLHRQIVLSATYRQSAAVREDAAAIDPDNRLLWRMRRRRLDVEMWRDAMLAVSGQLDLCMGGPSRPVDDLGYRRRTIYVTVAREELHPMLRMHDFPEASAHSPRREPTTTALQQLFVLNSPWIEQQAERLWQRLESLPTDRARIDVAYRLLFSRGPNAEEMKLAERFLRSGDARQTSIADPLTPQRTAGWQDYLQALLGLNEFYFVD